MDLCSKLHSGGYETMTVFPCWSARVNQFQCLHRKVKQGLIFNLHLEGVMVVFPVAVLVYCSKKVQSKEKCTSLRVSCLHLALDLSGTNVAWIA